MNIIEKLPCTVRNFIADHVDFEPKKLTAGFEWNKDEYACTASGKLKIYRQFRIELPMVTFHWNTYKERAL